MRMMITGKFARRIFVAVKYCANVKSGEKVLLLYDDAVQQEIVNVFSTCISCIDANVIPFLHTPERAFLPLKESCRFANASITGVEYANSLKDALFESDVALFLTSDLGLNFWDAFRQYLEKGGRALYVPYLSRDIVLTLFPDSREEVEQLQERCRRVLSVFSDAREVTLTSQEGTKLRLSIGNYLPRYSDGCITAGRADLLPFGRMSRAPDDGSAEGTLVVDRSIGGPEYKKLSMPITMEVSQGNVRQISGSLEAQELKDFLERCGDPNVYHLTELSVGLNPNCTLREIRTIAEDTHTLGIVSLALGCDSHQGGKVRAPVHIDCTIRRPTLEMDGKEITRNGTFVL